MSESHADTGADAEAWRRYQAPPRADRLGRALAGLDPLPAQLAPHAELLRLADSDRLPRRPQRWVSAETRMAFDASKGRPVPAPVREGWCEEDPNALLRSAGATVLCAIEGIASARGDGDRAREASWKQRGGAALDAIGRWAAVLAPVIAAERVIEEFRASAPVKTRPPVTGAEARH